MSLNNFMWLSTMPTWGVSLCHYIFHTKCEQQWLWRDCAKTHTLLNPSSCQDNKYLHFMMYHKTSLSPPVKIFLLAVSRRRFHCGSFLLVMFRVYHAFLSVHCSLVVACWERAYPLALSYVMLFCVFVTFPCGVLGQVCYMIVSIPDLCLLTSNSMQVNPVQFMHPLFHL